MRWLIVNADYPAFLGWLYEAQPSLAGASYDDQMRARNATMFGTADFYSAELRRLGHEAVIVSHQLPIWITRLRVERRSFLHDPRRRQCTQLFGVGEDERRVIDQRASDGDALLLAA